MNFKDFLLKFSFINKKFIDDFYNIIREDYIEKYNDFLIDSEILRKWLIINNRQSFIKTIKRTYISDVDYIINKKKRYKGSGGHNYEDIWLTSECAKKICQATKSKMGKEIRQYFIDIEYVLYKYKDYIINELTKNNQQLEYNQKPKINNETGMIYVFKALNSDLTLYKLGNTINSKNRFKNYNSGNANDIEIIFQFETESPHQIEKCVKSLIKEKQYRKWKEIYKIDIDVLKQIIKGCRNLMQKINTSKKQIGGNENEILYMLIPNNI